jgi:hypothetical protein
MSKRPARYKQYLFNNKVKEPQRTVFYHRKQFEQAETNEQPIALVTQNETETRTDLLEHVQIIPEQPSFFGPHLMLESDLEPCLVQDDNNVPTNDDSLDILDLLINENVDEPPNKFEICMALVALFFSTKMTQTAFSKTIKLLNIVYNNA